VFTTRGHIAAGAGVLVRMLRTSKVGVGDKVGVEEDSIRVNWREGFPRISVEVIAGCNRAFTVAVWSFRTGWVKVWSGVKLTLTIGDGVKPSFTNGEELGEASTVEIAADVESVGIGELQADRIKPKMITHRIEGERRRMVEMTPSIFVLYLIGIIC
jgi:hypothetical protein